jgi:hypothetical protein
MEENDKRTIQKMLFVRLSMSLDTPHLQLKVQSSEKPLKQYPYNDEVSNMKRGLQAFITKYHPAYAIKFTGNKFGCDNQRRSKPLVLK